MTPDGVAEIIATAAVSGWFDEILEDLDLESDAHSARNRVRLTLEDGEGHIDAFTITVERATKNGGAE